MCIVQATNEYTKTRGIDLNPSLYLFRLTIADLPPLQNLTKCTLVSDIAKTFDVFSWISPMIIKGENSVAETVGVENRLG